MLAVDDRCLVNGDVFVEVRKSGLILVRENKVGFNDDS